MREPAPWRMASLHAPPAFLLAAAGLLAPLGAPACAGADAPPEPPAAGPQGAADEPPRIPEDVLDKLLGPIALYPDPLLAVILPAATAPADVCAAAAYLVQYADMARIDSQPWDPSVRALAHYPAVLSWMADNIEWTRAVGAAFLESPSGVLQAIQRLRARAVAAGALASTPRQRVIEDGSAIEIVPAEPEAIYAPAYDSDQVYSDEPYSGYGGPYLDFGPALEVGPWLVYDLDWDGGGVFVGDWGRWHGPDGWHRPRHDRGHAPPGTHRWTPRPPGPGAAPPARGWHGERLPLPRPQPGAPRPASPQPGRGPAQDAPRRDAAAQPSRGAPPPPAGDPGPAAGPARPGPAEERVPAPAVPPGSAPRASAAAEGPPAPRRADVPAPGANAAPAPAPASPREAAPAQSRESASAPARESAPAPSRGASPGPAPASDARNH